MEYHLSHFAAFPLNLFWGHKFFSHHWLLLGTLLKLSTWHLCDRTTMPPAKTLPQLAALYMMLPRYIKWQLPLKTHCCAEPEDWAAVCCSARWPRLPERSSLGWKPGWDSSAYDSWTQPTRSGSVQVRKLAKMSTVTWQGSWRGQIWQLTCACSLTTVSASRCKLPTF